MIDVTFCGLAIAYLIGFLLKDNRHPHPLDMNSLVQILADLDSWGSKYASYKNRTNGSTITCFDYYNRKLNKVRVRVGLGLGLGLGANEDVEK